MIKLEAKNIRLPSANRRLIPGLKRWTLNPAYRKDLQALAYILLASSHDDGKPSGPPYYIFIDVETHKDTDNVIKGVLDLLEHIQLINNDKNVTRLEIHKTPRKRGEPEEIHIEIQKA